MGPGVAAIRRKAIEFVFVHVYQSPPEIEWPHLLLIFKICQVLQIPKGLYTVIRRVLVPVLAAQTEGVACDEGAKLKTRGRKNLIAEYDECAQIVYYAMGIGQSI